MSSQEFSQIASKTPWPKLTRVEGTQAFAMVLPPFEGDLTKSLLLDELFDYLYRFAEEFSPRDKFKSAGMMIGRNQNRELVVLVAPNAVPFALEQAGITGEDGFQGERLDSKLDNATVHFETHLMLASAFFGPLVDVILINSDPMCPPCSNNIAIFAHEKSMRHIYDQAAMARPIAQKSVCQNDAFQTLTLSRLKRGGVRVLSHDKGQIKTTWGHFFSQRPVKMKDYRYDPTYMNTRFYFEKPRPFAMLIQPNQDMILCEASDNIKGGNYNGQDLGVINPLTSVLIEGARQGVDFSRCNAVLVGCNPGVNCALTAVTAQIGRLDICADQKISHGAQDVLELGLKGRYGLHPEKRFINYKAISPHSLASPSRAAHRRPGISGSSQS